VAGGREGGKRGYQSQAGQDLRLSGSVNKGSGVMAAGLHNVAKRLPGSQLPDYSLVVTDMHIV